MMKRLMTLAVLTLATSLVSAQDAFPSVPALLETPPTAGDAASGALVWVHPTDPKLSLIIAADENGGIETYDLSGASFQRLPDGKLKSVDLRYDFQFGGITSAIVIAAEEDEPLLYAYLVNPDTRQLETIGTLQTGISLAGVCLYRSPYTRTFYAFALAESGNLEQYALDGEDGELSAELRRVFSVGGEAESCYVDDGLSRFYVSEGDIALWRYGAEPEAGNGRALVDLTGERGNISEELEGIFVVEGEGTAGYLVVSNEKANAFNVYERDGDNAFLGTFSISAGDAADAVTEPTAFGAVAFGLNDSFPRGVFVTSDENNTDPRADRNFKLADWGAIEDALGLTPLVADPRLLSRQTRLSSGIAIVIPDAETVPVPSGTDAADDSALWIDPSDPSQSLIIATDKTSGLAVYELSGALLQAEDIGRVNNVDIRQNFSLSDGTSIPVIVATNRTDNSLEIYTLDAQARQIVDVAARTIISPMREVYGICLYQSALSGETFAFLNSADTGEVEQYRLFEVDGGKLDAELVRQWVIGSQTEGCVADDELGFIYIGEEAQGVTKYFAEPDADTTSLLTVDDTKRAGNLTADVEGMTLYLQADGAGYLIVSSQGDSTFAVYERGGDNAYLGSFSIIEGETIDAVSGTDGIDVTSVALGDAYPEGVFIAQDDLNINPDENQNFKLVSWVRIREALDLD